MGHGGQAPGAFRRWAALTAGTAVIVLFFSFARLPAPALIGSIAVAVLLGRDMKLPRWCFQGAQAVIGFMIGQNVTGDFLASFAFRWPLVLAVSTMTVAVSLSFGWGFYKSGLLDRATALWGSLPGAASAMVAMSDASGANMGLVALVQYVRVISVAVLAAVAGGALSHDGASELQLPEAWSWAGLAIAIAIIAGLTFLSGRLRVVGLCLIGAMVLSAGVQLSGIASVRLPDWLMVCAYCAIGWQVGMTAGRDTLMRAGPLLLPLLASTVILFAICGIVALGIDSVSGVGLHTAFLATIPGGLDVVAVIAATTGADVAFVMLFQTFRFLLVVIIGVPILNHFLRDSASIKGEAKK